MSKGALELWNSYQLEENNDPVQARRYHEQLQGYIWEQVEAHQKRDQAPTDEPDQTQVRRRFKRLPRKIPWMFLIWGMAAFFVLLTIFVHSLKSLGT